MLSPIMGDQIEKKLDNEWALGLYVMVCKV